MNLFLNLTLLLFIKHLLNGIVKHFLKIFSRLYIINKLLLYELSLSLLVRQHASVTSTPDRFLICIRREL